MKMRTLIAAAVLVLTAGGAGAGDEPGGMESPLDRGPYIQNVTAQSAVFMGRPVPRLRDSRVTVEVSSERGRIRTARGWFDSQKDTFEIRIPGLPADTLLSYRIRVGDKYTGSFPFRTMPSSPGGKITFAAYGDTRTHADKHRMVADAMASNSPLFVLCSGDLVEDGRVAGRWEKEFFGPAARLLASSPVYPCLGNHENSAPLFNNLFSLPGNETWYAFTSGPVRVFTLNQYTNLEAGSAQHDWLARGLARKFDGWTLLQFHEPLFGSSMKRGPSLKWIEILAPLMETGRVDLCLCGHDHQYVRTRALSATDGGWPTTHIVAGGGGAPLYPVVASPWTVTGTGALHHIVFNATADTLDAKVMAPDGTLIDSFTLSRAEPPAAAAYGPLVAAAPPLPAPLPTRPPAPAPHCNVPALSGINIDGNTGDWADRGVFLPLVIPLGEGDKVSEPLADTSNLTAKVRIGWESGRLLLAAEITDNAWYEHDDTNSLWKLDGMELFLAGDSVTRERLQWIVTPGMTTNQATPRIRTYDYRKDAELLKETPGAVVARTVSGNTCTIEIALPLKAVGVTARPGATAAFQVYVNDADSTDSGPLHGTWYPGTGTFNNPSQAGILKLAE